MDNGLLPSIFKLHHGRKLQAMMRAGMGEEEDEEDDDDDDAE
jgi:hypothetical protein